jgi:KDO2-lipid IV(A) lauroyltransferase
MGFWFTSVNITPYIVQVKLGRALGSFLFRLNIKRKKVALRNLQLCYPELSNAEHHALTLAAMESTAIGIFESGAAWFMQRYRLKMKYKIEGLEHLQRAQAENKGVLFMGIHFTPIEIGAAFVNLAHPIDGFYRPHTNPVYEYLQALGRVRHNNQSHVIPNGDVRKIVKALRDGHVVNYAPDQDYGLRRSCFAPFFGVNTATVKAPSQLAKAGRAEVIPWTCTRTSDFGEYIIKIYPPITEQLNGEDEQNAIFINDFIEARIRENPEQYLWVHRRFKTRPEGEPSLYSDLK